MSVEDLKTLERRFVEELNKGKEAAMAIIEETCATDIVDHGGSGEVTHGLADFKKSMSELYNGFPDIQFTIDDIVAEGHKVAVRFTLSGTHTGEFMGIPPTNKKVTAWGIWIDHIVDGKFVEKWARYDTLGVQQQLGLIPTPKTEP